MKHLSISILFLLLPITVIGQKPMWGDGYHKDLQYSYLDAYSDEGNTLDEAREKVYKKANYKRSRATGHFVNIQEKDGKINSNSQNNLEIKDRVIDEYYETIMGGYRVHMLFQTARNPTYNFEPVNVTDNYSAGARVAIPGWAQIYKGQTAKGLIMLAGVVGCGVGALVFENTRSDYKNKMKEQPEFAQTYNTKANNNETARNICIGAAGAFYLWSLIDGIASKGKRRVFIGKNSGLAFYPTASGEGACLALTYNF